MKKNHFIQHCRIFARVVRAGSFGRLNEESGLAISQISRTIQTLENTLNQKLLERTSTGVELTVEGAIFIKKIRPLLQQLTRLEEHFALQLETILRMDVPPTEGIVLLAPWVAQFQNRNPDVKVEMRYHGSQEKVDYAIADFQLSVSHEPTEEDMIALALGPIHLSMVATPEYLMNYGDIFEPEDLLLHRLIYSPKETPSQYTLHKAATTYTIALQEKATPCNTPLELKTMALAHSGIAVGIPRYLVAQEIKNHQLVEILPEWTVPSPTLWLMRLPQRFPSHHGRLFIEWLRTCAQKELSGIH